MSSRDLREQYRNILIEQINADRYPSPMMLQRYEQSIRDVETAEEYVGFLLELVGQDRYPSPQMLDRIAQLIGQLDAIEARAEDSTSQ